MPKMDERVEIIGSSILTQAQQESKALIAKANEIRKREIALSEDDTIQTMFNMVQKKSSAIRLEKVRAIAAAQVKAQQQLLRRREELTSTVFAGAKTRLFEFAGSQAYRQALLDGVQQALSTTAKGWDHHSSTVFLRECDLSLSAPIEKLMPGCAVQVDKDIKIGGWKLYNSAAGILLDGTLDAQLESQRPWFLQTCGLKVTE